jgi:hypothetical protein
MKDDTYNSKDLSNLLEIQKDKPVYLRCAYNYYKIKRVVDMGNFIMIESPEDEAVIALDDEQ